MMSSIVAIAFGLGPEYHTEESSTSHHVQGVGLGEGDVDRVLETDWVCEKEGDTVTVTDGV